MCFFSFALGSTIICIVIIYVHIIEVLHGSFAQAFLNVERIYLKYFRILQWRNQKCHNPKQHDESHLQVQFHSLITLETVLMSFCGGNVLQHKISNIPKI